MKSQRPEKLDSGANLYHYTRENEHEKSRIHLRIDPDGTGTLIVNANRVMHLNPTAALMAHLLLEDKSEPEILTSITRHYRVKSEQAREDLSAASRVIASRRRLPGPRARSGNGHALQRAPLGALPHGPCPDLSL
jgi:hypothetical protein